jgi:LysM repeat protein
VALAAILVLVAQWSAPTTSARNVQQMGTVTVRPGQSLWSIAASIAPQRDPRQVVFELQRINHLTSPQVTVGQHLQIRS